MTTTFPCFCISFHILFEEKKRWLTLVLTLQIWVLCSKSHEGQFDAQMILTWCFLGRKNGIETLEEFKLTTYTIIFFFCLPKFSNVEFPCYPDQRQYFAFGLSHPVRFRGLTPRFLIVIIPSCRSCFFDQMTKNLAFVTTFTTTSLTSAWQKATACCTSVHWEPQYTRAVTQPQNRHTTA